MFTLFPESFGKDQSYRHAQEAFGLFESTSRRTRGSHRGFCQQLGQSQTALNFSVSGEGSVNKSQKDAGPVGLVLLQMKISNRHQPVLLTNRERQKYAIRFRDFGRVFENLDFVGSRFHK